MDKRRFNGGNSTKSKNPETDGRRTAKKYKELQGVLRADAIEDMVALGLHKEIPQQLYKLVMKGDIRAIELSCKYMFGEPKQELDVTSGGDPISISPVEWVK